jgi:hypothetical protein
VCQFLWRVGGERWKRTDEVRAYVEPHVEELG